MKAVKCFCSKPFGIPNDHGLDYTSWPHHGTKVSFGPEHMLGTIDRRLNGIKTHSESVFLIDINLCKTF